jgi:hypothetical protein
MNWRDPIGRGKSVGGEKCTMDCERDSYVVESLLVEWKLYGPTFGGCLLSLSRCNKGLRKEDSHQMLDRITSTRPAVTLQHNCPSPSPWYTSHHPHSSLFLLDLTNS